MPESTLALSVTDLRNEVSRYLGYGATYSSATSDQQSQVDMCLGSGLRQFYFPAPIQGQPEAHRWSFLEPTTSLSTVLNQYAYDLPDYFAGFRGDITFSPSDNVYFSIPLVGETAIRKAQQLSSGVSGHPVKAAYVPKPITEGFGQRFSLLLWPTPDAVYTLTYAYTILPNALTASNTYPYGGAAHAETILESCLAVAEQRLNDESTVHAQKFLERLAASIMIDARMFKPDKLGYNGDRSDGFERWRGRGVRCYEDNIVTYNGVTPS